MTPKGMHSLHEYFGFVCSDLVLLCQPFVAYDFKAKFIHLFTQTNIFALTMCKVLFYHTFKKTYKRLQQRGIQINQMLMRVY